MTKSGAELNSAVPVGRGAVDFVWGERYGNETTVDVAKGYSISVTVSPASFSARISAI